MRKSFRGNKPEKAKEFRVNEKIFSPELMIIDEEGQNLGVMTKWQALEEAKNRGLDLIEVSPKAVPPIAKFMDYGSYKYQKEKLERKQKAKQKTVEVKTIKLSARISPHDMDIRADQAVRFLNDGDKVRIELQLKGRENQHADLARESINNVVKQIKTKLAELSPDKNVRIEQDIIKLGNKLSTIIYL